MALFKKKSGKSNKMKSKSKSTDKKDIKGKMDVGPSEKFKKQFGMMK